MHHRATHVATTAIELVVARDEVEAADVLERLDEGVSASTVTRVLQQLEQDGWLARDGQRAKVWKPGTQAYVFADLTHAD